MNISCYFPGQPNSITKKLTDREYSRREITLTCLAAGILSAAIGYTQKNAFLTTGTGVLIANQILYTDTQYKENTPMQILSFVSFCSFLGLSLKQSWVKSSNATPSTWTYSAIKTTLALLALSTLALTTLDGTSIFAKNTIKIIDEKSSIKLLVMGALTASAASTFLIPRLGYFIPYVLGLSLYYNLTHTQQTKESLGDSLALFQKSACYPLLLLLGSSIGLLARSRLGPKNHTPSLPLLAKVPLLSLTILTPLNFVVICAVLHFKGPKLMTYTNEFTWKQSLKDGLLDRIQFAENENFESFTELERSINEKFPDIVNAYRNAFFNFFISVRITPDRQIPEVLKELKEFLNRIT